MNVIIKINGREAIPVRAIPLLTNWQTMTPDALAQALAGDAHFFQFENMQAYRFDGGEALCKSYWSANMVRPLLALSDTIKASEISHETGLQGFHDESLKKLPAGVFVWRDEFAQAHHRHYREPSLPLDFEGNDERLTDAQVSTLTTAHKERIALDFSPFIDTAMHALIVQGFNDLPSDTAPVGVASAAKPWLSIEQQDPKPAQDWYTPARYFARQLAIEKPALLANRELLADKVSTALFNAGFKKRGGKLRFDSGTVKKALVNVTLG